MNRSAIRLPLLALSRRPRRPARAQVAAVAAAVLTAWLPAALPVLAADTPEPAPRAAADPLAAARQHIDKRNWTAAVGELKRVNATRSADWNNLMGYSLRRQANPDLAGAERHYDAALQIDPSHRGALEYSGELALMQGRLERAEQRLAALEKACGGKCEELDDLKAAVQRYKANGNRYQAKP